MKSKIFSYVLRYDDGAAPNPFWGICTLTICKPAIRRTAKIGDWVIGTGSKNSKCEDGINHDFSNHLVYAMKISKILTMSDYDIYCKQYIPEKIPDWKNRDWKKRIGDCIYDFSNGKDPNIRKSVHNEANRIKDLSGINSLLSDTFYYFGEKAIVIPQNLKKIIKRNQGHLKIENEELVFLFENWIKEFSKNKITSNPQLKHEFDKDFSEIQISNCSKRDLIEDKNEDESIIC